jgi:hypothetical protein
MSAPIATTGLAEKTQISIVQLLTISGRAIPKKQAKQPHSVDAGYPLTFFFWRPSERLINLTVWTMVPRDIKKQLKIV